VHGRRIPDKSTPVARRGRKARSVEREVCARGRPVAEGKSSATGAFEATIVRRALGYIKEGDVLVNEIADTVLVAPLRLVAEHRADFRNEALKTIERAATAGHSIVVDLTSTVEIDSSGLGLLVLVEKRARERGIKTVLRKPGTEVRTMLAATKLEMLFTIQD
jgi:anti-anti-sigma factor